MRHITQLGIHIPVGVGDAQGRFAEIAPAHCGIGQVVGPVVGAAGAFVAGQRGRVVDAASEVAEINLSARLGGKHYRHVVGADVDELLRGGGGHRTCG